MDRFYSQNYLIYQIIVNILDSKELMQSDMFDGFKLNNDKHPLREVMWRSVSESTLGKV